MVLLYNIWKYFFKEYYEFGSVSPFWIGRKNICARVDSIQSWINWKYIPTPINKPVKDKFCNPPYTILQYKLQKMIYAEKCKLGPIRILLVRKYGIRNQIQKKILMFAV